jgi:hypothetical protein
MLAKKALPEAAREVSCSIALQPFTTSVRQLDVNQIRSPAAL